MKHLIKYSESVSDGWEKLRDNLEEVGRDEFTGSIAEKFTDRERKLIASILSNKAIVDYRYLDNTLQIGSDFYAIYTLLITTKDHLTFIRKSDDEWFYVLYWDYYDGNEHNVKLDQMRGLLDWMDSYFKNKSV